MIVCILHGARYAVPVLCKQSVSWRIIEVLKKNFSFRRTQTLQGTMQTVGIMQTIGNYVTPQG
jgi:hypothetical protein